ncbi:MAG: alpha/beta hydrolase [Pseudomonadota bacterium]|jgi:lysophospholipase
MILEPAPLVAVPGAPIPAGGEAHWLRAYDELRLRAAYFPPTGAARGSVVLSPGRTEPIEKYFEVVAELQARGFAVLVHDWRGQGLSGRLSDDPLKGCANGWRPFLADYETVIEAFADRLPKPWIAMGHSMGGGLTSLALTEGEGRFAAAVLSAPMLGINLGGRDAVQTRWVAWLMTVIGRDEAYPAPPTDPWADSFETNALTHDRGRWERTRAQFAAAPELMLGSVTWGWLYFALALARRIEKSRRAESLTLPVTIVAAGEEKLVANVASKAFAGRLQKGRWLQVPGAYHEILQETDPVRAVFWQAFDETVAGVL